MNAEENWNGPVQDAIREWDAKQGHQPVTPVVFFQPPLRPNGGTVFVRPGPNTLAPVDFFRHAPNGGATVFVNPECVEDGDESTGGENGDK
jgi:hypothetical protein